MRTGRLAVAAGAAAILVLGGTGCVTKRQFRENSEAVDSRVSGVESAVEANERRVGDLKAETDVRIGAVDEKASKAQQIGTEALGKAEEAAVAARGKILWTVSLSDDKVKFNVDESILSPGAMAMLDDLAGKVKSYGKAVYVEIEGHTDSTGPEAHNMMLGEKRAMAVRNYLNRTGGIPLHAINTISYGETQPVSDNSSREGRSQNRRVVVKVLE